MRHAGRALLLLVIATGCGTGAQQAASASPTATVAAPPPPTPSPSPSPIALGPPQYRALWVDAFNDGMKSRSQIEKLVADARRGNINALIVQVRKRGDAYFNRGDEPRALDVTGSRGFDPLSYVIELAHQSRPRIEVHAWLNTFFVGDTSGVYLKHGDAWANRTNDGATGGYLDPAIPEVQTYTHKIFMDLARNYDVDGLHMDFVRYPGANWGYSPAALSLYTHDTGATGVPAPADARWQAWRRERVTAFVRDLHDDLQQTRPSVKLSAALICFGGGPANLAGWGRTSAYTSVFQDWADWMLKGYLDFGVPMNYDSEWIGREKGWFDAWLSFEKDSGFANRLVTGVGAFLNYPDDSLAEIRRVLAPSPRGNQVLGVAIYSYASTSVYGSSDFYNSPDLYGGLPRQPYAGGINTADGLAQRAHTFNESFMSQLSEPADYRDVQLGVVRTQPVFTLPAEVPALSAS